jgi:hypothetical protein
MDGQRFGARLGEAGALLALMSACRTPALESQMQTVTDVTL